MTPVTQPGIRADPYSGRANISSGHLLYLQRFDSPCIFSEGGWKTRSVQWAEKQLRLLAASRAVCQAAEQGHVCP